ncbi:hypothetical protein THAOC_03649 [Thalassiosira oceanica]|uniref:Uncharacterized protein n=1 Tax=Thalassiosira oceanica TaxID=159749 RepID=K0T7C8_THAOC|nr:hypothetical protein THAOC_03649 [Thalassiosira oceanica]|eukprot:EJK74663.1 hypothetical protein THAOC_03649 [Thalassiosira oceanica]
MEKLRAAIGDDGAAVRFVCSTQHRLPLRPERRRHESSDEDDDGVTTAVTLVDAAGRAKRMSSGNRSGLQDAGDLAAAERKLRERQRSPKGGGRSTPLRRERGGSGPDREGEGERRQLRSNKGARQRELEDLEAAAQLAAASSMTVARGIDNQYRPIPRVAKECREPSMAAHAWKEAGGGIRRDGRRA